MSNLENLVDQLSSLTVLQAAELAKLLEEKWGVSAAAAAVAVAPAAASGGAAAAEKTEFDVVLVSAGDSKLKVVTEVKNAAGIGLKEAKDLVDGVPATVKAGLPKAEAEKLKAQLESAGAKVELK